MSRATRDLITLHHVLHATLHTPPLESGFCGSKLECFALCSNRFLHECPVLFVMLENRNSQTPWDASIER